MSVVIDASVGIQWVVDESTSALALPLLDALPRVPDLFYAECANILWKMVARDELSAGEARDCAETLALAQLEVVPSRLLFEEAVQLAIELQHPAYDCIYLALARIADMPLVTADRRLIRRVSECGQPELARLVRPLAPSEH